MSTSDLLVELMLSWIRQREQCAEKLKKLAKELESLREKCNASECFGSSAAVLGGASLIGAGVATLATGGAAAPFLGLLGATYTGIGVAVSVGTKMIEEFISSDTMKEAQKIEKKSKEIAEKIEQQFKQLKEEVKKLNPSADPDEVDRLIVSEFAGAFARQSGLTQSDNSITDKELQFFLDIGQGNMRLNQSFQPELMVGLASILTFFTFSVCGKKSKLLFAKGAELLTKEMSKVGLKTALKGGAMVVGGAVVLAFELPEMIDNWKDLIKNNHVTKASQSLRDTAKDILKMTRLLREQLNNIKQELKVLSDVKCCINNSKRSSDDRKKLIDFAIRMCKNEAVIKWLEENLKSEVFFKLVDLFNFLKQQLDEEKEKIDCRENIHITFVAHGSIEESMIPASCLLPLSTIEDVLLYSPWNCTIDAKVAYGVATGRIEPQDRVFDCGGGCQIPDDGHQPTNLPNRWNSMKRAGGQMIPNIFVSTLRKPEDGAWERFKFLKDKFGQPGRNRIIIPFILPGVNSMRVPFFVVTLALSLVLSFSGFKATVHLTACLSKRSKNTRLHEGYLKEQYACTIDETNMTCSEEIFDRRYPDLYRALKAVFG